MSQLTKYIIGAVLTAVVIFICWFFSNIVAYILISAVLAIIGKPIVDSLVKLRIGKFRFPRWLAAAVGLLTIWMAMLLFFSFILPLVFSKLSELAKFDIYYITDSFKQPLQSFQDFLEKFFSIERDNNYLIDEISRQLSGIVDFSAVNSFLASIVSVVGNTAIALFSISFITYFFLKEDNLFVGMVTTVFPKKYEQNIIHAIDSITKLLIRYFTGILAESTIILILLSCIFMLWGVPVETALFMGLVVGILNVIPYIGPLIGACICLVVGILTPIEGVSIYEMSLIIVGTVLFVQAIDNFVLQPFLYSKRVNAHPLEIFIVILIAGSIAGVLGMLLAIPAYNVIRVFAKEFFYNFRIVRKLTENI